MRIARCAGAGSDCEPDQEESQRMNSALSDSGVTIKSTDLARHEAYEDWKRWSGDSFGAFTQSDAVYYRAEIARAGLDVAPGLRILEIGFGNGRFAGWAKSSGMIYVGSELNPRLVSRANDANFRAFGSDLEVFVELGPDSIDLAVAFDVLEHLVLDQLEGTLVSVRKVLRPGGRLLARVPSGDSPFGRAILNGDVTHRMALGSSAVHQLAASHGFEVVTIGSPSLPMRGVGVRHAVRRSLLRVVRRVIGATIDTVFHEGRPRVITPNLVFVLRKP